MPFSAEPLSSHLGDYVADLEKRNRAGRKGRGARKVKMRVTTLLKECNWQFAYNIQRGLVHQLEKPASEVCSEAQPSSASDGFVLNWLERSGRIKGNPLKFIGKIDERGQSKRVLRAFNDDELQRLVAGSGARGLIYFTAARTGLRQERAAATRLGRPAVGRCGSAGACPGGLREEQERGTRAARSGNCRSVAGASITRSLAG
jgi:hypothetical protein